ncbi:MAG: class I SAM-dependent methyltransferase [Planctomycetes bacterium]|nr:class I SAM-dependent methyltransferase [Planctomycetota bacterium]
MLPSPLDRWHDPALIDHLAHVRKPWDVLTRRIVRAVLTKFLPKPPGPVVEVGAGGGQLREWLPAELVSDVLHTEPSEPFVRAFRERHPGANVIRAEAAALPFEPASVGAALALCVLDTVPDIASVRDELRRVLRPGGEVVHFLDLATSPDCLFPELIAGGELPLTNFARDSALLGVLTDAQKALLPPADAFDEVLALPWDAWAAFVGMLERSKHPLAANLGPYAGLTAPGALDPEKLARGFIAAGAEPAGLLALNRSLLALTLSARQLGRAWPLRAVSSRAHVRERLRTTFDAGHGFAVEFAGPVAAREVVAAGGSLPEDVRFVLRHAGRTITRAELPSAEYGTPADVFDGEPVPPRATEGGQVVRETTVEVFVARRI